MPKYAADPNAPKRPATGYFLFMADERPRITAAHPELQGKVSEMAKAIGEAWKNLSDAKKAPYINKASKAKEVYAKKNAEYRKTPGYAAWLEGKKEWTKKNKASNEKKRLKAMLEHAPKRPMSGYMLFGNAMRSSIQKPGMSAPDTAKAIGAAWGSASADVKAKYQGMANAAKAQYTKDLAKYHETEEYKNYLAAVDESKEAAKKEKKRAKKAAARLAAKAN